MRDLRVLRVFEIGLRPRPIVGRAGENQKGNRWKGVAHFVIIFRYVIIR